MRCVGPDLEEHRSLQNKLIAVDRLAEAVEEALQCVASENQAEILAITGGDVEEFLANRGRDISGDCPSSSESLQIRLDHIRYPADFGGLPQIVHSRFSVSQALAERFEGHIETDLVPVFEAIRNGLGDRENSRGYAFDVMYFLAELKG